MADWDEIMDYEIEQKIDREKADAIRARIAALEAQLSDRHAERVREIDAQMERVAGLEAQLAQYRWRRVDEELPERFMDVLVVDSDGWHFIAHTDSRRWLPNHPDMEAVTHWMPLPPAPAEGK